MIEVLVSNKPALYPLEYKSWAEFMAFCKRQNRKNFRFTVADEKGIPRWHFLGAVQIDGCGQRFLGDCLKTSAHAVRDFTLSSYITGANAAAFGINEANPENSSRIIEAEFDFDNTDFSFEIYSTLFKRYWSIEGNLGCDDLNDFLTNKNRLLSLARAIEFTKQLRKALDQDLEPTYVLKRILDVEEILRGVGIKAGEREKLLKKEAHELEGLASRIRSATGS